MKFLVDYIAACYKINVLLIKEDGIMNIGWRSLESLPHRALEVMVRNVAFNLSAAGKPQNVPSWTA